ncbi:MAG TPA: winged helix-turn-helix domain-containing protein [Ilumatobacter sp.]|nr:winged helix-turn-helix domain-containing protein [Ilumatobacter sp.]
MSDIESPSPGGVDNGIDYELDDELDLDTPERLKAVGDPLRGLICDLVLERAMSVTDLAQVSGRPRGSVAHHVGVLVDAGLLKVVRTRQVRAVVERFYGRTARTFKFGRAHDGLPFAAAAIAEFDDTHPLAAHASATLRRARVPLDRVDEYVRRLEALALEFSREPRSGDAEFGLYFVVFPTNRLRGAEQ